MTLEKRVEKLEKELGNKGGRCTCPKPYRLVLPEDFPGAEKRQKAKQEPTEGICEKCGGHWESVTILIDWDEEQQKPVRKDIVRGRITKTYE